jgi:hypothetical protein
MLNGSGIVGQLLESYPLCCHRSFFQLLLHPMSLQSYHPLLKLSLRQTLHASPDIFQKQKGATHVVTSSYDDYNSYLLITCAKTHYTWVFFTASKDSPCNIVQTFLK